MLLLSSHSFGSSGISFSLRSRTFLYLFTSFIYSGLAVGVASPSPDIFIILFVSGRIVPFWIKYLRSYLRIHLGKTSPFKKYRLGVWILHMRYFLPRPRSIKSLKWFCQPPTHPVGKMSQVWPDYFFDGIKIKTIKNKMSNLNLKKP